MPTTSNFGWTTPADTDLVKDGAAAIRTLGNGIDTSLVDLKGGTTGQILSKASNTDLDYTWITNDVGDITAVTAGTGITGGGTSGAVTITNDMATTITASGDIIVGTGSGTYDNLPIGSTGQVLTADTTVSPYKVKWASASGASMKGCLLVNSGPQSLSDNTATILNFNSETYDTDGFHDNSTNNSRITIPTGLGGKYLIQGMVHLESDNTTGVRKLLLWKNGTGTGTNRLINFFRPGESTQNILISKVISLVAGDYVELQGLQTSGGSLNYFATDDGYGFFSATFIGA